MRHIPNALCVLRMLLLAPIACLLLAKEHGLTLLLFALAAATDGLDGFLAKRCGWTSELGRVLDPLADKILLVGVFMILTALGRIPLWLTCTVVARDVMIMAGAVVYRRLYGHLHGRPTIISKFNTLCQILYLLLVVAAGAAARDWQAAVTVLGALVFVTTAVSGLDYAITYTRKALGESRRPQLPGVRLR